MRITPEQIEPVLALYEQGLMLRAYAAAEAVAPLREWLGPAGRVMAGRLAGQLGGERLQSTLHTLALREDADDPLAIYYHARVVLTRYGPLPAWEAMNPRGDFEQAPPEIRSHWYSMTGQVLASFRDFGAASTWFDRAEKLSPDDAWVCVERSYALEREDRYADALAAARRALAIRPWYRPAVQATAHLLELTGRDDEALDLLRDAADRVESGHVLSQLAALLSERGEHEGERATLDRIVALWPLAEKRTRQWLAARRSDAAYLCGDHDAALQLAEQAATPFHLNVARKLRETRGQGARVVLPVGFVRQHHMTCAPATLSALGRFWQKDADHLSVSERICYDGTPAHSERRWAAENGWAVREFRADWPTAVALIDRGVPFTFTTVEPTGGHLQAIIGYDAFRGTLIARDPFFRHFGEFATELTMERYRATGPRGMALVPLDRADLLAGLELPEAGLYDELYAVLSALERHDRTAAAEALARLEAAHPGHRLTLWARRSIAGYDRDLPRLLECYDRLLELYPGDAVLTSDRLPLLRDLARRDERVEVLRQKAMEKDADPIFMEQYARELLDDGRESARAERLLRRMLRRRPLQASGFQALADVLWGQRRFEPALQLYRFACCLGDKTEAFARSYFEAARHFHQSEVALAMFRERFERFGRTSAGPARLLFWAYERLNRVPEALAVLEEALSLRPEDGELHLAYADALARRGRINDAAPHIDAAERRAPRSYWLRVVADLALYRGEPARSLELWRELVQLEPLAMDANNRVTQLLAQTQGLAAAIAHLDAACARFPHHYPLLQSRLLWLKDEAPERRAAATDELIAVHPADGWARRERVDVLLKSGRIEDARQEAGRALELDPHNPSSHHFLGIVAGYEKKWDEARDHFRRAIALSVDDGYAVGALLSCCHTPEQRVEALAFVRGELVRQTVYGDGLFAYRTEASRVLDPEALLESLDEALAARPDLWHAWSARTDQLVAMSRFDDAVANARSAVERFPLLPRLWLDLAQACRGSSDRAAEQAALEEALAINPSWGEAARQLSTLHERNNDLDGSRVVLERALARDPMDSLTHGYSADVLWKLGEREKAVERVSRAVQLNPGYDWAWGRLKYFAGQLNRPKLAEELARDLTVRRAGEPRSWIVLARTLGRREDLDERLAALDRAIALNPRSDSAHDVKAVILCEAGRYDDALAACRPDGWGGWVPVEIRGRAAWVEAERKNYVAAISQMQEVLAENPRYFWGWSELASWYAQIDDKDQYLSAARTMYEYWPMECKSHGQLADALLRKGDRAAAKRALRRAMELEANYAYASGKLFDLELEDDELEAAATALAFYRSHIGGVLATWRALRLAAADPRNDAAVTEFARLCDDPEADAELIDKALKLMVEKGWSLNAEATLARALETSPHTDVIAARLIGRFVTSGRLRAARALIESQSNNEKARRATTHEYLRAIADRKKTAQVLLYLLAHRRRLRADVTLWGTAGYALQLVRRYRAAVRWLRDWRSRDGVEPWMLVNLSEAYRALGRDREAHAISEHALTLREDPRATGIHRLWLAADAALAADLERADDLLRPVDMARQAKPFKFLRDLIDVLVDSQRPGDNSFPKLREKIEVAERAYPAYKTDRELARFRRKCLWAFSRQRRGLKAKLWCWNRLAN